MFIYFITTFIFIIKFYSYSYESMKFKNLKSIRFNNEKSCYKCMYIKIIKQKKRYLLYIMHKNYIKIIQKPEPNKCDKSSVENNQK